MVPKGWESGVIEDIAQVSSGGTPSRQKDSYWVNGSIPWVTTAEVKFNVITDTEQKITEEGLQNSSAKLYPKNTILMAMYGQGKTRGQVAKLGIEASTNQACAALQLHEGFDVDYYYQYLISQYENIRELANSGGQQNLSGGIVKGINIPIPPLLEQQKIAKILSTWDKAISTTERLIENSTQQKKALMQQLLTGRKRLLDESGKRFVDEWKEVKIKKLCAKVIDNRGKTPPLSTNGLPLVEINSIVGSKYPQLSKITKFVSEDTFNTWFRNGHPTKGDILVATVGSAGINALVDLEEGFGCVAQNLIALRTKPCVDNTFLYYLMNTPDYFSKVQAVVMGAVQPSIKVPHLLDFSLLIPILEEQQKIATVLTNADKEIELLEQQLADLQQEKKALMQVLLTGKKRVVVNGEVA